MRSNEVPMRHQWRLCVLNWERRDWKDRFWRLLAERRALQPHENEDFAFGLVFRTFRHDLITSGEATPRDFWSEAGTVVSYAPNPLLAPPADPVEYERKLREALRLPPRSPSSSPAQLRLVITDNPAGLPRDGEQR